MTNETLNALLEFERYIPVMGYAELSQLKAGRRDWDIEDIRRWEVLLVLRNRERDSRISASMQRSKSGQKCNKSASVK